MPNLAIDKKSPLIIFLLNRRSRSNFSLSINSIEFGEAVKENLDFVGSGNTSIFLRPKELMLCLLLEFL